MEELNNKQFTRERIRNRMIKRAADIWGFAESEMDDFDPLVGLIIESCAIELEKLSLEIGKTQHRMLERLANLIHPRLIDVSPAYGVVHARASEPISILNEETQFVYRPSKKDRKDANVEEEFFFSPCMKTKIFDGCIRFIGSNRGLYQIDKGIQKSHVVSGSAVNPALAHSLWLGIELNENIASLKDISFFFQWINQPDSAVWLEYLSNAQWRIGDIPLKTTMGFATVEESASGINLGKKFDEMSEIESIAIDIFRKNSITIQSELSLESGDIKRQEYPEIFESIFDQASLQQLQEPLIWIKVIFPSTIPLEALDAVFCQLNAFPAINRKLNKVPYKLTQSLNIVPLATEDAFLSIKEITNSDGEKIRLLPIQQGELPDDSYNLRYGINRFDAGDAQDALVQMMALLKEESAYFTSIGSDFLEQNIRELNQTLARMNTRIKSQNKHQSPYPYLIIKPRREGANVMIQYWTCKGERTNKIPMGSALQPYRGSDVKSDSLFFLTTTTAGNNKMGESEKIEHLKRMLLTHNRLVTMEDIKIAVRNEMGKNAKDIQIRKTYTKGVGPDEGFMRCVQIIINPKKNVMGNDEWQAKLDELLIKLQQQAANNIPFKLVLEKA